ncbi:unnamed protein product [Amoebophrya sp. A25]|nr:unnamed protein product [Amoebophrya sp. A25]|eukprot:GSA25T00013399001.1
MSSSSTNGSTSSAAPIAQVGNVRFDVFCRFLENLHRSRKKKDKLETLWGFLRPVSDGDLWPAFRLIFPHADRHRGNYEMKENKLGKLLAEVLGVPDKEKRRLLGFRDAALQEGFRCIPGDFSSVLFSLVEIRANYASGGLTVSDVNRVLDQLSVEYEDLQPVQAPQGDAEAAAGATTAAGEQEGKGNAAAGATAGAGSGTKQDKSSFRVLLAGVRKMSPVEIKWLARFVLKDTKLGFSPESVLARFHKDALPLYQEVADLKMVLDRLRLGVNSTESLSSVNFLFQRIQPMLSGRLGVEQCDAKLFQWYAKKQAAEAQAREQQQQQTGGKRKQADTSGREDEAPWNSVADGAQRGHADAGDGQHGVSLDDANKDKDEESVATGGEGNPQFAASEAGEKPAYFIETKLDGERMVCHIDKVQGRLELFTRNGNDYTPKYGPQMKETILSCFGGEQGILDGEILGFDESLQTFLPFGTNRNCSLDLSGKTHLCYMVFDILMFKGKSEQRIYDLRSNTLATRKNVLHKVVRQKKNWVELVEPRGPYSTVEEIEQELTQAVERREEGIMVKHTGSRYRFNSRKAGWWKLKPEYGSRYADHLDLVVIGGYFADTQTRRRGGTDLVDNVSKFLLALRVGGGGTEEGDENRNGDADPENAVMGDDKNADGEAAGEHEESAAAAIAGMKPLRRGDGGKDNGTRQVVSFAKVATGYSHDELSNICELLRPYVVRYDAAKPPSWLPYKFPAHTRPDVVYRNLEDANVVLEIEASEIVRSVDFELGYTMRFPRCVRMRDDKGFDESMSFEELQEFMQAEAASQRFSLAMGRRKRAGDTEGDEKLMDAAVEKQKQKMPRVVKKPKVVGKIGGDHLGLPSDDEQKDLMNTARNQILLSGLRATKDKTGLQQGPPPTSLASLLHFAVASAVEDPERALQVFRGLEICVLNGPDGRRHVLDRLLQDYGARVVAQFRKDHTDLVVAGGVDIRVRNHLKVCRTDVMHAAYLLECIHDQISRRSSNTRDQAQKIEDEQRDVTLQAAGEASVGFRMKSLRRLLIPRKRHFLLSTPKTQKQLDLDSDKFGDSFTVEMTRADWDAIEEAVPREAENEFGEDVINGAIMELQVPEGGGLGFF